MREKWKKKFLLPWQITPLARLDNICKISAHSPLEDKLHNLRRCICSSNEKTGKVLSWSSFAQRVGNENSYRLVHHSRKCAKFFNTPESQKWKGVLIILFLWFIFLKLHTWMIFSEVTMLDQTRHLGKSDVLNYVYYVRSCLQPAARCQLQPSHRVIDQVWERGKHEKKNLNQSRCVTLRATTS
jgi:hypothetical protein